MWALIRTLAYSVEVNVNKIILNKIKPIKFLAHKYWLGIILLLIYALTTNMYIAKEGIFILFVVISILTVQQFISFNGLARVNATTHVILAQSRLIVLLFISLILGYVISFATVLGLILLLIGGILVALQEVSQSENTKNTFKGMVFALTAPFFVIINSYLLGYGLDNNYFSVSVYSLSAIIMIIVFYNTLNVWSKKSQKNNTEEESGLIDKKTFGLIQLAGVLSVTVNITKALSIERVGVFFTEMISALAPLFIFAIALILKTEKISIRRTVGIVLSIIGVLIYII